MKERSDEPRQEDVTILFVEDDANDIILLSRALSRSAVSAEAQFVQDPTELRDYLVGNGKFSDRQRYPVPNMILTDYKLGQGSAKDVIRLVRHSEVFRDIPIIVLSSFVPPREIADMIGAGARAYLEKPLDFQGFCKVLASAMQLARN